MTLSRSAGRRVPAKRESIDPVYASAEAAFQRDDLESCSLLLGVCEPASQAERARASLLRAKVARIAGDDERWFASARAALHDDAPADVQLSALALLALAARRCKSAREASRLFDRLRAQSALAQPVDAAYATYVAALDAWESRDYGEAERLAKKNIARVADQSESIALLGWIAVKRECYAEAGAFFRRALDVVRKIEPLPVRQYGTMVQCVVNMAVETADLAVCAQMAKEYEKVPWTPSLALTRFAVLGRLRYAAQLCGDLERAWFYGRAEASVFEDGPYAAFGECALAIATRSLGDEKSADLALQKAWSILRTFRWGGAHAEQRTALLDFACAAALQRPSEARKALMLYVSITETEDVAESLTRDRRVLATESWAAGRVAGALGKRAESIAHYQKALELFQVLGCVMRAADVAVDLLRSTRDERYRAPIDALAARAPNAHIVRRAREFAGPLGKLAPAQRNILAKILRGEGAKAIAAELGRSPYTVINHTRKIFDAFEVHSRAELRRVCAEAKITAESIS